MSSYPPATQSYDNSRQYNAPPLQSPYQPANTSPQDRSMYAQSNYVKSEMGPPSSRPSISGLPTDQDNKPANGYSSQGSEHVSQQGPDDEADHEHEAEYTHDRSTYDTGNSQYNYSAPPLAPIQSDHPHLSPEMAGSAGHQGASGRSTPRSAAPPQYYPQQGYNTSPRTSTQSGMYNVVSNDRGPTNGDYASHADMNSSLQNGYAPAPMNGASGGMKRGRDDEEEQRPLSGGPGMDMKRRKTLALDTAPAQAVYQSAPAVAAPTRRR